jgi:hypothetical protein
MRLPTSPELDHVNTQHPLYYDEKGVLTKREDLSTKRKLIIITKQLRYLSILDPTKHDYGNDSSVNGSTWLYHRLRCSFKFKHLHVAEKLHVLHRFGIDLPGVIEPTNNDLYSIKLDRYIEGIIGK